MSFRGQAFHKAAKILVSAFDGGKAPWNDGDTVPIISLYRQATELHLKAIILGYGGTFLPVKPVPARIHGTHSLRVFVALASRILEAVGWDRGFKTDCVADLCDLRAIIGKLETFDTSLRVFQRSGRKEIAIGSVAAIIPDFAKQMDAALDILDGAADGLAAMADTGGLMAHELGNERMQ